MRRVSRSFLTLLTFTAVFSGCNAISEIVPNIPVQSPTTGGGAAIPTPVPSATGVPVPTPQPSSSPVATQPPPVPSSPRIALVYGGPGVLTGADDTLVRAKFVAAKAGFKVIEVDAPVDSTVLNSASIWIQPGGPNLSADSYMNQNGMADQVRDFVRRGGGYVGFCGGAFSAVNNLGLIEGAAYNLNQATEKVAVDWLGKIRYIHFEEGPYIELSGKAAEVVATYANGSTAAARAHYGKGEVFISGVHPEANSDWPPTYDPDGSDVDLAIGMIQEVAALPTL